MLNVKLQYFKTVLTILVGVILVSPFVVEAKTVIRSGDTVSIGQDQLIEGDFYTIANIINLSGEVQEDLLAVGTEVNINGKVGKDVLILGANVDIHGTIGDDLRVLGGTVIIAEPVLGDVFVIGGTIQILQTASISGDLTIIGSTADVRGLVEGDISGWVEKLRIDSEVMGSIDITTPALTLGEKANVSGDVKYVSQQQLIRSQSATVGGEVFRNDPVVDEATQMSVALPLLALIFSVALWYLFSRPLLTRVANRALLPRIRVALLGILVLLFAPFAISILMISMLGFLVGLVLLSGYILLLAASVIALPAVLGQFVFVITKDDVPPVTLTTLLVGTLLFGLCLFVPYIGPIIALGFFVLTFGSVIDLVLKANK